MSEAIQEEKHERGFQGVWIPAEIWEEKRITWMQKCLLAEIGSLATTSRGCFASNDYLGKVFGTSAESIANQITKLRKLGFIKDLGFDGRKRSMKVPCYGPFVLRRVNQTMKAGFTNQLTLEGSPYIQEVLVENSCGEREKEFQEKAAAIYSAYPRKVDRPKALKVILKLLIGSKDRKPVDPELLLARVVAFAAVWEDAKTDEMKYCPHPATWFNGDRFNDHPSTWRIKERSKEYHVPNI